MWWRVLGRWRRSGLECRRSLAQRIVPFEIAVWRGVSPRSFWVTVGRKKRGLEGKERILKIKD